MGGLVKDHQSTLSLRFLQIGRANWWWGAIQRERPRQILTNGFFEITVRLVYFEHLLPVATYHKIRFTAAHYVAHHTFAMSLKRSGVATGVISEAMGHANENTTQIYLSKFETNEVDEAYDNL